MNFERAKQIGEFGEQYFVSLKGRPISEEVKPIKNRHVEGQIDEWHIVKYDGCIASYYRVVPEKRNILSSLTLTSQKVQLPHGIHIGVRKSFILNLLGKPTNSSWDEITYEQERWGDVVYYVHFTDDLILELTGNSYIKC
jgi:hypothetical protein